MRKISKGIYSPNPKIFSDLPQLEIKPKKSLSKDQEDISNYASSLLFPMDENTKKFTHIFKHKKSKPLGRMENIEFKVKDGEMELTANLAIPKENIKRFEDLYGIKLKYNKKDATKKSTAKPINSSTSSAR